MLLEYIKQCCIPIASRYINAVLYATYLTIIDVDLKQYLGPLFKGLDIKWWWFTKRLVSTTKQQRKNKHKSLILIAICHTHFLDHVFGLFHELQTAGQAFLQHAQTVIQFAVVLLLIAHVFNQAMQAEDSTTTDM